MFTGLVQAVGEVIACLDGRLAIAAPDAWPGDPLCVGESISVNGCCLTLVAGEGELLFDLSPETIERTALGGLGHGSKVNLERALRASDRLGGHIVQGHVDGVGHLRSVHEAGGAWTYRFEAPEGGERYLIDKGSVCINGISLTVVQPSGREFDVAVIPHTRTETNLGTTLPGDPVNIEYDVLAKHVERLLSLR